MDRQEVSELFKALSDESRVRIVKVLYDTDEICACRFLDIVHCGQPTLSHHLKVLLKSRLVFQRREGKKVYYSCNKGLIQELMSFFNRKCDSSGGEA